MPTERHTLTAILFALCLIQLSACDGLVEEEGCTLLGCLDGLEVDFDRAAWPAGDYRVVVTIDGTETECAVTLPFASCDVAPACPGEDLQLGLSGCALDASEHEISGLTVFKTDLATLDVSVFEGDTPIGAAQFTPTFETSQPNGPTCGPTCISAPGERLALD